MRVRLVEPPTMPATSPAESDGDYRPSGDSESEVGSEEQQPPTPEKRPEAAKASPRRSGRPMTVRAKPPAKSWGLYKKPAAATIIPCPAPGCSKSYARPDTMRKHLRDVHGFAKEQALSAVPQKRLDQCPACEKWFKNITVHRKVCKATLEAAAERRRPVVARKAPRESKSKVSVAYLDVTYRSSFSNRNSIQRRRPGYGGGANGEGSPPERGVCEVV